MNRAIRTVAAGAVAALVALPVAAADKPSNVVVLATGGTIAGAAASDVQAAYTSGGEQQMCAIGRALMANPKMVLLDEPSMGLAPQIVQEVFEIVRDLNTKERVTFLLAEQNTNMALRYADYGYILENGRVVMDGEAAELRENEDVKEFYLGVGGGDRKSFRDVKSYKRRKRWLA